MIAKTDQNYKVYISAETIGNSELDNEHRTEELADVLDVAGYVFRECTGSYEGALETVYEVEAYDLDRVHYLVQVAKEFNQDSVLVTEPDTSLRNRIGTLYFMSGGVNKVGTWTKVSQEQALDSASWTKIGSDYYICTPERLRIAR